MHIISTLILRHGCGARDPVCVTTTVMIIVMNVMIIMMIVAAGQEAWQGFFRGLDPQQAVSLSAHELNFGSCSRLSPGGHQVLTVTNVTNAKVTAFLVVPGWKGHSSQSQMHQVFQVCLRLLSMPKCCAVLCMLRIDVMLPALMLYRSHLVLL